MRKRLGQSHFQVSGPVVQRNVPESSGFLLVVFFVNFWGGYAVFHFQRNFISIIFTVIGKN